MAWVGEETPLVVPPTGPVSFKFFQMAHIPVSSNYLAKLHRQWRYLCAAAMPIIPPFFGVCGQH